VSLSLKNNAHSRCGCQFLCLCSARASNSSSRKDNFIPKNTKTIMLHRGELLLLAHNLLSRFFNIFGKCAVLEMDENKATNIIRNDTRTNITILLSTTHFMCTKILQSLNENRLSLDSRQDVIQLRIELSLFHQIYRTLFSYCGSFSLMVEL
jgi:hypothetical protein